MKLRIILCLILIMNLLYVYAQDATQNNNTELQTTLISEDITPASSQVETKNSFTNDERALSFETTEESIPINGTPGVNIIVRSVVILLLIIFALYGVLLFIRKKMHFSSTEIDSSLLRIISTQSLSPHCLIHIVQIVDDLYIMASSAHNVTCIEHITDQDTIDKLLLQVSNENKPSKSTYFTTMLQKSMRDSSIKGSTFLQKQKDKIRNM